MGEWHVVRYDRRRRYIRRLSGEGVDREGGRGGMGADVMRSEGAAHASIRTGLTGNKAGLTTAVTRKVLDGNQSEKKDQRKKCSTGGFTLKYVLQRRFHFNTVGTVVFDCPLVSDLRDYKKNLTDRIQRCHRDTLMICTRIKSHIKPCVFILTASSEIMVRNTFNTSNNSWIHF